MVGEMERSFICGDGPISGLVWTLLSIISQHPRRHVVMLDPFQSVQFLDFSRCDVVRIYDGQEVGKRGERADGASSDKYLV